MRPTDFLRCLTVDFAHAPHALRVAFEFPVDEVRDLLCLAGGQDLPLIILYTPSALTLISTSQHHVRAFKPVLASVRERTLGLEGWRTLPVRIASGSDAGRQLLRHAVPNSCFEPEIRDFVRALRRAAELSSSCDAFSSELAALVRMTDHAAARVCDEARQGNTSSNEAEAELETLAAERILEEELVAWQSSYPALRSSLHPVNDDIAQFTGEERQSMVRIRVGNTLSKLRSA